MLAGYASDWRTISEVQEGLLRLKGEECVYVSM